MKAITDALLFHKFTPVLEELDLSKCGITNEQCKSIAALLDKKYKIRTLNLSNNNITDEGGRLLLSSCQLNPYITKFKLDLNPTRTQYSKDIEQICNQN